MERKAIQPNQFILQQRIIHGALSSGVILFGVISQLTLRTEPLAFGITDNLDYAAMFLVASALVGQWKIRETMLQNISRDLPLSEKLAKYQVISIIVFALLEGAALFSLVISFLNNSGLALVFGALALLGLIAAMPSRNKVIQDLKLSTEEKSNL